MNKKSTLVGGVFLVVGTAVGGGMLAMPVLTSFSGFLPGLLANLLICLFMMFTGLLFLETTLKFPKYTNILSMTNELLGKYSKYIVGFLFMFLYYNLLLSYTSAIAQIIEKVFSFNNSYIISNLVVGLFFILVITSRGSKIDRINRILGYGLILAFVLLLGERFYNISFDLLQYKKWSKVYLSVPVFFAAYGYHNIIPTIAHYLDKDKQLLRKSIIIGSAITFILYAIWQFCILGSVKPSILMQSLQSGAPVTEVLGYKNILSLLSSVFTFFALSTSFIGVAFSMSDFFFDGLKLNRNGIKRFSVASFVIIPPVVVSIFNKGIFIKSFSFAGGVGESILNGLVPIVLFYRSLKFKNFTVSKFLSNKLLLLITASFAIFIVILEVLKVCKNFLQY